MVDANREVELAKQYLENSEAFATVVEYKDRKAVVQPSMGSPDRPMYQEKDITSSMMKLTRDKPMTISFLTGHGEKDIDKSAIDGIKGFADFLRNDGYNVAKLNLILGRRSDQSQDRFWPLSGDKRRYQIKNLILSERLLAMAGSSLLQLIPAQ